MFADIHNHILPGVDDGAATMAEALRMARMAVLEGTDLMAATPHRAAYSRRDAPPKWVRENVARLQAALNDAGIPLTIAPGTEIPLGPHVAEELADGKLMTLNDAGRWVLIEPPFERIPRDGLDNLLAIQEAGFGVVLAHPERNAVIQRDLTFVEACADMGIAFQITTGSLLGYFGPSARRAAESILAHAETWQIVLASDMHDTSERPPNLMVAARDAAAVLVGAEKAQAMVDTTPRSFLARI